MSMPFESAMSDAKEFVSESAEISQPTEHGQPLVEVEQLFDQHARRATRYAMSVVGKWADAEEIVQDAFCRLIRSKAMTKVETESAARAMLFTTVRNLSIDRLRRSGRQKNDSIDLQAIEAIETGHSTTRLSQLETEITRAMGDLPDEWAEALKLKVNANLNYAEIADVLSASHNQVRTWIYRARKQLREELKHSGVLGDES